MRAQHVRHNVRNSARNVEDRVLKPECERAVASNGEFLECDGVDARGEDGLAKWCEDDQGREQHLTTPTESEHRTADERNGERRNRSASDADNVDDP